MILEASYFIRNYLNHNKDQTYLENPLYFLTNLKLFSQKLRFCKILYITPNRHVISGIKKRHKEESPVTPANHAIFHSTPIHDTN